MTVIDAHCHAWEYWPYQPPVPDPESRGRIEQLLFEMDQNRVDRAVVICAGIDYNPRNNDYIAAQVKRWPNRLVQFADIDSRWLATHHTRGAAERLTEAAERWNLKGFTHYLKRDTEWFGSDEGIAFFETAARLGLIASLALGPEWQPALRTLARVPAGWDAAAASALAMQVSLSPTTAERWGLDTGFEIDYRGLFSRNLAQLSARLREVEGETDRLTLLAPALGDALDLFGLEAWSKR